MANKHRIQAFYRAECVGGEWQVVDRNHHAIYDSMNGEEPLSAQEAHDLAWAWNNGARDDDAAVHLIVSTYGYKPLWLYWREDTPAPPFWGGKPMEVLS